MTLIERMRDTLEEHQGTGNYCLIDELTEAIAALEAAEKALDDLLDSVYDLTQFHDEIHSVKQAQAALEAIRK